MADADLRIVDMPDAKDAVQDPSLVDLFSKISSNIKALSYNVARRVVGNTEGWRPLSMQNGWVNYSANYSLPEFYKDPFGTVHTRGVVAGGTTTANTVLATLQKGCRPENRLMFVSLSAGIAIARIDILPNGDIVLGAAAGSSTYLSLCLPPFRAYR